MKSKIFRWRVGIQFFGQDQVWIISGRRFGDAFKKAFLQHHQYIVDDELKYQILITKHPGRTLREISLSINTKKASLKGYSLKADWKIDRKRGFFDYNFSNGEFMVLKGPYEAKTISKYQIVGAGIGLDELNDWWKKQ